MMLFQAFIRQLSRHLLLLVEIEAALRSGKTHRQIWQRLADDGLDITCETFCRLVRRARKNKTHIHGAGR